MRASTGVCDGRIGDLQLAQVFPARHVPPALKCHRRWPGCIVVSSRALIAESCMHIRARLHAQVQACTREIANTFVSTTPHPHMKRRFCFSTETHSLERVIATPRRATPSDAVLQLRARNRVCNRVRTVTIPIRAG